MFEKEVKDKVLPESFINPQPIANCSMNTKLNYDEAAQAVIRYYTTHDCSAATIKTTLNNLKVIMGRYGFDEMGEEAIISLKVTLREHGIKDNTMHQPIWL
jgi:hypothetical protein